MTAWPDDENTIGASAALPLARFLFTAREVARALSVSTTPAFQHALSGGLPCRRIARLARYTTRRTACHDTKDLKAPFVSRRGGVGDVAAATAQPARPALTADGQAERPGASGTGRHHGP